MDIFSPTQHQELKLHTYIQTHVYQCTFMSTCVGIGHKAIKGIIRGKKEILKEIVDQLKGAERRANWERKGTNHKWGIAEGVGGGEQWTTKENDKYI